VASEGEDCKEAWRQKGSRNKPGGERWETRYCVLVSTCESIDSKGALPEGHMIWGLDLTSVVAPSFVANVKRRIPSLLMHSRRFETSSPRAGETASPVGCIRGSTDEVRQAARCLYAYRAIRSDTKLRKMMSNPNSVKPNGKWKR
jgi:hypothetical protein